MIGQPSSSPSFGCYSSFSFLTISSSLVSDATLILEHRDRPPLGPVLAALVVGSLVAWMTVKDRLHRTRRIPQRQPAKGGGRDFGPELHWVVLQTIFSPTDVKLQLRQDLPLGTGSENNLELRYSAEGVQLHLHGPMTEVKDRQTSEQ